MTNTIEVQIIERGNNNRIVRKVKLTEEEFTLDLQQIIKHLVESHGYLTRLLLGYDFLLSMDFRKELKKYIKDE